MGKKVELKSIKEKRYLKKIESLIKQNTLDLQEMAERGKELVKVARITRGCKSLMQEPVFTKLIEVINDFEARCT